MMRRTRTVGVLLVVIALAVFLLPVVPFSVKYACFGPSTLCPSYSTWASVTYASFHTGAVYVTNNQGVHTYCWMESNPVNQAGGAMCGTLTQ